MNTYLLLLINGWAGHSQLLDATMVACAKYLIFIVFGVGLICIGLYAYRKEWKTVIYFCASLVLSFILLKLAALLNFDHRPFMDHHLDQLVSHAPGSSFPSDHTTASMAVALSILSFTKFKKTGVLLILAALLIGFARIFVGIHYPADILGGVIVALIGSGIVYGVMRLQGHKGLRFSVK